PPNRLGVRVCAISRMGTRTSGLAPWTKTLREPGIGRVTDAESSPACWTSEAASGMAFIGVVLGRPRGIRGTGTKRRRGRPAWGVVAKLPYAGVNRIRFEG